MPMYSYKCNKCNHQADYLVKFDSATPACKQCASVKQTKQLSTGTAFCLMGHGWAKNGMNSKRVGS